jgi:hypothetical protein
VFDYVGADGGDTYYEITDKNTGFPTIHGAQAVCDEHIQGKPYPVRLIDFFDGGIDIICSNKIDDRGDINQNGQTYEIADAVMFTNYFIVGLDAFSWPGFPAETQARMREAAIAASDVNNDGVPLTVADLVYMIRVIIGDAPMMPKVASVGINYVHADNGDLSTLNDTKIAAVVLTVSGNAMPTTSNKDLNLLYKFDGTNTRIIATMPLTVKTDGFSGTFMNVKGEILSIDMVTYAMQSVVPKEIPANYSLRQNYPNPFNPTTTLEFALPVAGNYDLTIYNVNGQVVKSFSGSAEAGYQKVVWDASNVASGVYFYRLSAGSFTDVRKMMLLK